MGMCGLDVPTSKQSAFNRWNRTEKESHCKPLREKFLANFTVRCCMLVLGKNEINSSVMKKSMRRPLSSQLQSVQALLPTEGMLRPDFVGRLCSGDVNLGVLGGALSCQEKQTVSNS